MNYLRKICLVVILLLISIPCRADVLLLKNGQQIEGEIVSFRKDKIKIKTKAGNKKIHYTLIKDIQANDAQGYKKVILERVNSLMNDYNDKVLDQANRKKAIEDNKRVDFYMYPQCPYCQKMARFLNENKIPHNRYNIQTDRLANKRYSRISRNQCGVPFLVIDDRYTVCGYNPSKLMKYLHKK